MCASVLVAMDSWCMPGCMGVHGFSVPRRLLWGFLLGGRHPQAVPGSCLTHPLELDAGMQDCTAMLAAGLELARGSTAVANGIKNARVLRSFDYTWAKPACSYSYRPAHFSLSESSPHNESATSAGHRRRARLPHTYPPETESILQTRWHIS